MARHCDGDLRDLMLLANVPEAARGVCVHRLLDDCLGKVEEGPDLTSCPGSDSWLTFGHLNPKEWKTLKSSFDLFLKMAGRAKKREDDLVATIERQFPPDFSQDIKDLLLSVCSHRRSDLDFFYAKSCLVKEHHLLDFDWTVNLILSSDKCSNMELPTILLDLNLSELSNEGKISRKLLDLGSSEVNLLIQSLEMALQNLPL